MAFHDLRGFHAVDIRAEVPRVRFCFPLRGGKRTEMRTKRGSVEMLLQLIR
jgi:hypothetical protein